MNPDWNQEQRRLKEDFARLAADRPLTCQDSFDSASWQALTDRGLWRFPVSPACGGRGKSWWEFAAALEGYASRSQDLGLLLSAIAHAGAIRAVMNNGSDEQRQLFLPRLLAGEIGATASTEPGGGSDVARVKTAAGYSGGNLILSGHKAHITNAPLAQIFVIVGRVPQLGEKQDITLFLLERGMEGLSTAPAETMLGNNSSPTGDILLDRVTVDEGVGVLGALGGGLDALYNMLCLDRVLYGLVASGYSESLLSAGLAHIKDRQSFRAPLASHQYVQEKIVGIKTNIEVARYLSYAALHHMIEEKPSASMMCSIAKMLGSEGLVENALEFIQIFGHAGYMEGGAARVLKDAVGTRIAGGTTEMQKVNIFNQLERLLKPKESANAA